MPLVDLRSVPALGCALQRSRAGWAPDGKDELGWAAVNLWLGRYHAAQALAAPTAPSLAATVKHWADALDATASFVAEPAKSHRGATHDGAGRVWHLDGVHLAADGSKVSHRAWLNRSSAPEETPFIIHFHGTAERAIDFTECDANYHLVGTGLEGVELDGACGYLRLMADLGNGFVALPASVLFVDFRGFGWSQQPPRFSYLCEDAEALIDALPRIVAECELPWPYPGPLVLYGKSAGSIPAAHLAALYGGPGRTFDALILDAAVGCLWPISLVFRHDNEALDALRMALVACGVRPLRPVDVGSGDLLGTRFSCSCCNRTDANTSPRRSAADKVRAQSEFVFDVVDKVGLYEGPLLVLHSIQDELCPFEGANKILAMAQGAPSRLVRFDDVGHQTFMESGQFWPAIGRFLAEAVVAKRTLAGRGLGANRYGIGKDAQEEEWEDVD